MAMAVLASLCGTRWRRRSSPPVGVFLAVGEHGEDQSGQLVDSGGDGPGLVHAGTHATVVRTQRRLTRTLGRCRQSRAWAARLALRLVLPSMTLPPVILVPGHKPNQEGSTTELIVGFFPEQDSR